QLLWWTVLRSTITMDRLIQYSITRYQSKKKLRTGRVHHFDYLPSSLPGHISSQSFQRSPCSTLHRSVADVMPTRREGWAQQHEDLKKSATRRAARTSP